MNTYINLKAVNVCISSYSGQRERQPGECSSDKIQIALNLYAKEEETDNFGYNHGSFREK